MYYTRPKLDPLGLDLAEISGGGMLPAQFSGRTVDGRPVYIRYRGGGLSVRAGEPGAIEDLRIMATLLDVAIGPPFDSDITLEAACELAGITLNGRPFEYRATPGWRDWTGCMTYWERGVRATRQGMAAFVQALEARLGAAIIIEATARRESVGECEHQPLLCFQPRYDDI